MTAELHCHSYFSVDGWASPEEVAANAAVTGVSVLSLTDHNSVEGLERCRARAEELGLRFIDGVEFDAKWRGGDYHALGFGFDPGDAALLEILERNWACYEINFGRWAPIIERRWGVTAGELREALRTRYRDRPSPPLNKWFARSYMLEKGIFPDRAAALEAMSSVASEAEGHLPSEEIWPFAPLQETVEAVHGAGGVILLAHVGGSRATLYEQLVLIEEMVAAGLDGFELYHGANMRYEHFEQLVAEARRLGCAVSGGSDSHSNPANAVTGIGRVPVPDWVVEALDAALAGRRSG
ncbi:MAG: PHP domain-containing protein [Planctomycetota bacterium]